MKSFSFLIRVQSAQSAFPTNPKICVQSGQSVFPTPTNPKSVSNPRNPCSLPIPNPNPKSLC